LLIGVQIAAFHGRRDCGARDCQESCV
jgi:hypothetical protein